MVGIRPGGKSPWQMTLRARKTVVNVRVGQVSAYRKPIEADLKRDSLYGKGNFLFHAINTANLCSAMGETSHWRRICNCSY